MTKRHISPSSKRAQQRRVGCWIYHREIKAEQLGWAILVLSSSRAQRLLDRRSAGHDAPSRRSAVPKIPADPAMLAHKQRTRQVSRDIDVSDIFGLLRPTNRRIHSLSLS
jgi:hypothetical protein